MFSRTDFVAAFALAAAILLPCRPAAALDLFVSPQGNDTWSGRTAQPKAGQTDGPLASLAGARDAVRRLKTAGPLAEPVHVRVAAGEYSLADTLTFTPADSGTAAAPIIYESAEAARPVFSGGRKLPPFQAHPDGTWRVQLPEVAAGKWYFEQLFVNGRRTLRARTPNGEPSILRLRTVREDVLEKGKSPKDTIINRVRRTVAMPPEHFKKLQPIGAAALADVALVVCQQWTMTRSHLTGIEPDTSSVISEGEGFPAPWLKPGARYHLENYEAALDAPGEWFLRRDGLLLYRPRPGETLQQTQAVAPVVDKFVVFKGDFAGKRFVEHIELRGMTFRHGQYLMPREGDFDIQAAVSIEAVILADAAHHLVIENCEISQIGLNAIWLRSACRDSRVEHCYLHDLGAGGVRVGTHEVDRAAMGKKESSPILRQLDAAEQFSRNITVRNNIIRGGGRIFLPAVGILLGHASDNLVSHNEICDFRYSGISVGWVWGNTFSPSKRNRIEFNHIHQIGQAFLSDMAGIYTLGQSEGTVVANNVVHDVVSDSYGGFGLYTDEGSSHIVLENNLIYNTRSGGYLHHYGRENVVRNNIFAFGTEGQLRRERVEAHRSFTFKNNIIYYKSGTLLINNWTGGPTKVLTRSNLYFDASGRHVQFGKMSFQEWQQSGQDVESTIADPLFVDADHYDFHLKENSPALTIGFKPFDYTQAGVTGEEGWIDLARHGTP